MQGIFLILFWATVFTVFFLYLAVAGWIIDKQEKRHKKRTAKVRTSDSSMDINISA